MARNELDRLVAAIAASVRARDVRPVVLVDGRSGSGKTEFGGALAAALDAQLVALDDLYPGWDGLLVGSELVRTDVLGRSRWRRWDWQSGSPGDERVIDPGRPLVVEGSGCLSRANRALATYGVWVELDETLRKRRALARDGEMYSPHWDAWAAQEQVFFDRERPDLLADVIVDGTNLLDESAAASD